MKSCKKRLLSLVCALALLCSLALPALAYTPQEQYDNLMAIIDLIKQVGINSSTDDDPLQKGLIALFEKDPEAYDKLMDAMLGSYDRYSNFVPAGNYEVSYPSNGDYVGVGITLEQYGQEIRIAEVTAGGSAAKAGVLAGDIITTIGGQSAYGMTITDASTLLRGEEGTKVTLGVRRSTGGFTFVLTRSTISISNFTSKSLEDGIYYMKWSRFAEVSAYIQFVFSIQDLVENRSKVLILDLRGNPGGEVDMALNALNRLIPDADKTFFTITSRDGEDVVYQESHSEGMGPRLNQIIILADGGSASASEIMISSLRDLGYAKVVGETTYGKARGQYHLVFDDGSAVVLTGLELIPPSKQDYDGVGLVPDYEVANTLAPHPASVCEKVPERFLNITNWSEDTAKLNRALIALELLDENKKQDLYEFDTLTRDALNEFRGFNGLAPQNYLDVQTAQLLNNRLAQFEGQQVAVDQQMEKALELAREYVQQPIQYTVDEYGNFKNSASGSEPADDGQPGEAVAPAALPEDNGQPAALGEAVTTPVPQS